MSIYFEEARRFGQMLLTCEQALRLADANNMLTAESKSKIDKYNSFQAESRMKAEKGALQESETAEIREKLRVMMEHMKADPLICELLNAQAEYNAFLNRLFGIIRMTAGGGESGCGGCSGCK